MKEIKLTQGYIALVDDEDFERCMEGPKWRASCGRGNYVVAVRGDHRYGSQQYMHRFLLGVYDPKVFVDHKDHNGLNNARNNLRQATNSQNLQNRGKQKNNTSGLKGVTWDKNNHKWVAQIWDNGKHVFLGRFADKEEAKIAYEIAANKHHGEFACTT